MDQEFPNNQISLKYRGMCKETEMGQTCLGDGGESMDQT